MNVFVVKDLNDARNTWHKIDHSKPSQFRAEEDRLSIMRLNKYDLSNFECRSEYENSHAKRRLELNGDEYKREMANFYTTSRHLEIVLVKELSDLRLGGKVTLRCTNEGRKTPKENKKSKKSIIKIYCF